MTVALIVVADEATRRPAPSEPVHPLDTPFGAPFNDVLTLILARLALAVGAIALLVFLLHRYIPPSHHAVALLTQSASFLLAALWAAWAPIVGHLRYHRWRRKLQPTPESDVASPSDPSRPRRIHHRRLAFQSVSSAPPLHPLHTEFCALFNDVLTLTLARLALGAAAIAFPVFLFHRYIPPSHHAVALWTLIASFLLAALWAAWAPIVGHLRYHRHRGHQPTTPSSRNQPPPELEEP